jgi:hypothetical protein
MFQARAALTELSFAGTPGVRRSTVTDDVKVVALERLAWRPPAARSAGRGSNS